MSIYRSALPQLGGDLFVTDGGIETTLIFHEGLELPEFASFPLLDTQAGRETLRRYFRAYADIAKRHGLGLVLESATWRASGDWAEKLGCPLPDLDRLNRTAVDELVKLRSEYGGDSPVVISGCIGPRRDAYRPDRHDSPEEAERYHGRQIGVFAETEADLVTAITMTHTEEAIGIARAAARAGMPSVISFTVETDGSLPSGQLLCDAIREVDTATDSAPAYYMLNCAHPTHFDSVLAKGEPWTERIGGLRANASALSHAELDAATELDEGDPAELARRYRELRERLPRLNVLGGCCGTDHRHVDAIVRSCVSG